MILGHSALVAAALFASAAFYINFAEQSGAARPRRSGRAAAMAAASYERAALMQASLAMVGFFFGSPRGGRAGTRYGWSALPRYRRRGPGRPWSSSRSTSG